MAKDVLHVTDATFDETVRSHPFVVIDFWAEWCRPCRAMDPVIEEFSAKYAGKVTFAKINSDENPRKVGEYGVMGIPTILFFQSGRLVDQVMGAMSRGAFEARIRKNLDG